MIIILRTTRKDMFNKRDNPDVSAEGESCTQKNN